MLAEVRYRLEVRLSPADVGRRVVIRWRRPAAGGGDEVTDVLGVLEAADGEAFTVRTAASDSVVVPVERVLAGKTVPPAPPRRGSQADD
jgi:N-acetylglutamate synthase